VTIVDLIEGADRAVARIVRDSARSSGEHTRRETIDLIEGADHAAARIVWDGVRSSGERTRRETIDIVRVAGGRAIEHWGGQS
jgi:hypothetical protein